MISLKSASNMYLNPLRIIFSILVHFFLGRTVPIYKGLGLLER